MKYIFLDDDSMAGGGTSLTSKAISENKIEDVIFLPVQELNIQCIEDNLENFWIIGNIMTLYNLDFNVISFLLNSCNFVKIEFDYNFCRARGEKCHVELLNEECNCPSGINGNLTISKVYNLILEKAKHIFFMSERQRAVYSVHLPFLNFSKTSILSSCFSKDSLKLFKKFRKNKKNKKYAISEGSGGWHSTAKGLKEAVEYCLSNNLEYEILPNRDYDKHIEELSYYYGFVFLPIIDDTCPRCIIEAKLLDLKVITNINSQHITEHWWNQDIKTLYKYLSGRPNYFWKTINGIQLQ